MTKSQNSQASEARRKKTTNPNKSNTKAKEKMMNPQNPHRIKITIIMNLKVKINSMSKGVKNPKCLMKKLIEY